MSLLCKDIQTGGNGGSDNEARDNALDEADNDTHCVHPGESRQGNAQQVHVKSLEGWVSNESAPQDADDEEDSGEERECF